ASAAGSREARAEKPHEPSGGSKPPTNQRWLSRNSVSCDFDSAPTLVSTTAPLRNSISVGLPRMPDLAGTDWFWSTLTLTPFILPAYSREASSRIGAIILQGPHHSAQ